MTPRGIRNNNPLNIVRGCNWKGLAKIQTDSRFCQFESMAYGLRAAFLLIRNYMTGRCADRVRRTSIQSIISRWAPSSENATGNYIRFVAQKSGVGRYDKVSWSDRSSVVAIVHAMAWFECGVNMDIEPFYSAYDLLA